MSKMQYHFRTLVVIYILSLTACATQNSQTAYTSRSDVKETATLQDEIEDKWGIRVLSIRLTSASYMLDFRYHVLDVEKASAIVTRKIKPHIVVERTGRKLFVPVAAKLGPLRQSPKFIQPDKNYFVFFANPGGAVKPGDKVTVVMGDATIEHLMVE